VSFLTKENTEMRSMMDDLNKKVNKKENELRSLAEKCKDRIDSLSLELKMINAKNKGKDREAYEGTENENIERENKLLKEGEKRMKTEIEHFRDKVFPSFPSFPSLISFLSSLSCGSCRRKMPTFRPN
jgi:chromosome segregation ATPase